MSGNNNPETFSGPAIRNGLCGICTAGCWVRAHLNDGVLTRKASPCLPVRSASQAIRIRPMQMN